MGQKEVAQSEHVNKEVDANISIILFQANGPGRWTKGCDQNREESLAQIHTICKKLPSTIMINLVSWWKDGVGHAVKTRVRRSRKERLH